jgi:hypothetical protein
MVSMTLAIPLELKKEMDRHPEMNWSEVARQSIKTRIELLERLDKLAENSRLTEKDAIELGRMVNRKVDIRFRKFIGEMKRSRVKK